MAYLIDAAFLLMFIPLSWILNIASFGLLIPVTGLFLFLLPFIYHPLCISSERGATIGQRMMGLRVVREDGGRLNLVQALLQTVLFYGTLALTGGLLLLWCLFDERSRCLHDIFSGTLTIRDE